MYRLTIETNIGKATIVSDGRCITECKLSGGDVGGDSCGVLDAAARELTEYLSGARKRFTVPLNPKGTEFQKQVWQALTEIEYGETRTYGEIAKKIGRENACRAVGRACALNPIWIFIPCHRCLGANKSLTGYAGGLEVKRALLDLEAD